MINANNIISRFKEAKEKERLKKLNITPEELDKMEMHVEQALLEKASDGLLPSAIIKFTRNGISVVGNHRSVPPEVIPAEGSMKDYYRELAQRLSMWAKVRREEAEINEDSFAIKVTVDVGSTHGRGDLR